MRRVIVHHAYHSDEQLHRLIHVAEETVIAQETNPAFLEYREQHHHEQDWQDAPPMLHSVEHTVRSDPQEIVWDARDERWDGLSSEEIAAEQLRDVREALARREQWAQEDRDAQAVRDAATQSYDSVGTEL